MAKRITRIVLTGGPAAGKTTLISRILKEFKQDDGWKVITIPETATELISGFGIRPFGNCVSMLDFQYFVIGDQLHKERLALKGAEMVPEENVLIIYDRALFDDKAYITDEQFRDILAYFGKTEQEVLAGYDAVLHLVSCAKGAEFAYNFGNEARYEPLETAREKDELTLRAWQAHPNLRVIDNSIDFEDKLRRGIRAIYDCLGMRAPQEVWHKYLIAMPDVEKLQTEFSASAMRLPTRMISVTFSCSWSIRATRFTTATGSVSGYADRNGICIRNAKTQHFRKKTSSAPLRAIWQRSKLVPDRRLFRARNRSHIAHIQSTRDSLRCTIITAICLAALKSGNTRRA